MLIYVCSDDYPIELKHIKFKIVKELSDELFLDIYSISPDDKISDIITLNGTRDEIKQFCQKLLKAIS